MARRLDRLPAGAREVALAVAILGPGAAPRHVAALAGRSADSAAAAADALRTAALLAPGTTLEFAHPILAAAVAAGLGPGQTALLHRRAWRLLHVDGADPERQALQLLQAEPEADPTAVAILRAAAQAANARGAPESATAYLRRALAEPPDAGTRPDVLLECGLALAAHRHSDAPALLREAIELTPDPAARVEAGLRAARALALAALYAELVELCRMTLADTRGARPETVARVEAELVGLGMTRAETRAESRVLIERARRDPPPVDLWRVNAGGLDTFENRSARETLALLHSADVASERDSIVATVVLGLMLVWNDDLEAALAHTDALLEACRPLGWASAVANCQWVRAMAALRAGRVAEAADDARQAHEFKLRVSPPHSRAWAVTPLVEALIECDELDEADAVLAGLDVDALEPGLLVRPTLFEARSRLRLAQQRPREALADARAAGADWVELECESAGVALWRIRAVEALLALGERAEARALAAEQLERAERHGAATSLAAALRAVARAAPTAEAIAALERAARSSPGRPQATTRFGRATAPWRRPGPPRTHPRARGSRRRAASARPRRGGARAAARGAPSRRPGRRRAAGRARAGGTARRRRTAAPCRAHRPWRAHARRAPRRDAGRRGPDEPPDRAGAVRHPAHGRDPPHAHVREARRHVSRRARRGPLARTCRRFKSCWHVAARRRARGTLTRMGRGVATQPAVIAGALLLLMGASLALRVGTLDTGYWIDEGIAVGIASHDLADIPRVLSQDGNPPLYYLLLHGWMQVFGTTEAATRALSLVFALLAVPASFWAGAALFDRRAGALAAAGAAGSPFLTYYAQETRMYSLVVLLSILASASFVLAFVRGDRRQLPLLGLWLVLLLYTHTWGLFLTAAMAVRVADAVAAR